MAALEKLNVDFGLNLPLRRKMTQAEQQAARRRQQVAKAHREFETWRRGLIVRLSEAYRVGHVALNKIEVPEDVDKLSSAEVMAIQWQPAFEFWADALSNGTPEEQMEVFRERKVIESRTEQTLKNTLTKSTTA